MSTCFGASSTYMFFFFEKSLKSQFLVVFQSSSSKLSLGRFWQNLVALGSFR
jgi:hypothetical protein